MKIRWHITESDVKRVRMLVENHANDAFVADRISRNLALEKPPIKRDGFWKRMVICLLTTQQRVGPTSKFHQFLKAKPSLLKLGFCRQKGEALIEFAEEELKSSGLRRNKKIADEIATNLRRLDDGLWKPIMERIDALRANQSAQVERETARFLGDNLKGIGPKQSRNLLQALGLTRYEVPLDSRLLGWLNDGLNVKLSSKSLGDEPLYRFVVDGFQELCKRAEQFPCVVDACIFVSFDKGGWSSEDMLS